MATLSPCPRWYLPGPRESDPVSEGSPLVLPAVHALEMAREEGRGRRTHTFLMPLFLKSLQRNFVC